MVQRQAGGAGLLNDRRAIMKGRKRGEEQVYEMCHPLFLFLNCAQSLQPPAVVERAQHGR